MDKLLQVKSDLLFHDLINQDNIKIIEWIIIKILNLSYDKVHNKCRVLDSRITRLSKKDKTKYVDLIIKYEEYEVILELNRNFNGNVIRNIIFGMTRMVGFYRKNKYINKKIYQRNYYKDKIKVMVVNLNWERVDIINKKLIENIDKLYGIIWSKKILFKVINISLDKYANMTYNEVKKRDRFYKLLTINNVEDLNKIIKDEPLVEEYGNKLIEYSKDEKYIKEEESMTEAMDKFFMEQEAYEYGEEKGKEKEKQNIILSMYEDNVPFKTISKYTKLSVNKIKEIINSKK